MARYLHSGLDIIVVDQTTPEQRRGAFRCVKVIIPGLLPMTFGHAMRRITGFERLYHPYASSNLMPACRRQSLTDADINLYPHPFP
jgi:ribosomal protein S12 methylthiotransferase accessory factor